MFPADNQAVTNAVKSMGYDYCQSQCLWEGKDTFHRSLEINGGLWTGQFWHHPDQLVILPLMARTFIGLDWLTRNSVVNFRNQSNCQSQCPSQCSRLCLLVWIWISWKFTHHQMSVSNRWFLSLKIWFLLKICISWTRTRLSSNFYLTFWQLKRRKMRVNNSEHVQANQTVFNTLHTCQFFRFIRQIEDTHH